MSIHLLNKAIHKAYDWLYDIAEELGEEGLDKALPALRAVFHVLRDQLPIESAANLADQLPTLIRGIFFESWKPGTLHSKDRTRDGFVYQVQDQLLITRLEINAEEAINAVLTVLAGRVSHGEIAKIKAVLPKGIRVFFEEIIE